ncbi:hypothetical protein ECE50_000935 [Chitinophaga sp. Mgbs1]|uniref:Beta-lactamase-inhibitor-like PepSY-like domain-containing protein n=1 Tax=Chitinophaga solisilvae TaxID=1233460 RepID=A0A9Q5D5K9_9BACT|nr:hypothetical protein [Chitinophaga solisilvae]
MMKQLLCALALLLTFTSQVSGQKKTGNVALKAIFNSAGNITLPTTIPNLTRQLGNKPKEINDDVHSTAYEWQLPNGVNISTLGEPNDIFAVFLESKTTAAVGGLPYKLVLNETSKTSCNTTFRAFNVQPWGESGLTFKRDGLFNYLDFNMDGKLVSVSQSTFDFNTIN